MRRKQRIRGPFRVCAHHGTARPQGETIETWEKTYERHHATEELRDTVQSARKKLVIAQLPSDRVVSQSQEINVSMVRVETLAETNQQK